MPILQKSFNYHGELKNLPLDNVQVYITYPCFRYSYSPRSEVDIERKIISTQTIEFQQSLHIHGYHQEIPQDAFWGDNESPVKLSNYLQQIFSNQFIDLDSLIIPLDVQFSSATTGMFIDQQQIELICLDTANQIQLVSANGVPVTDRPLSESSHPHLWLLDRVRLESLLNELNQLSKSDNFDLFLHLIRDLLVFTDAMGKVQITAAMTERLVSILIEKGVQQASQVLGTLVEKLAHLLDIPIVVPEINVLKVSGIFSIKTPESTLATDADLMLYDLSIEFLQASIGSPPELKTISLDWELNQAQLEHNSIPFSFDQSDLVFVNAVKSPVKVNTKAADGSLLWTIKLLAGDPKLEKLAINVKQLQVNKLGDSGKKSKQDKNKKLRGKVISLNKDVPLNNLTIVVQAKRAGDTTWYPVTATNTDSMGNFSLPYPYGNFAAAQALVSAAPGSPADLLINTNAPEDQSISDDFLYLLIKDAEVQPAEDSMVDDYPCQSGKTVPRLPDQADLIGSNDYSQDLGGGCINLSKPNRTLREYNYHAIVRTSDPDVANYTLVKQGEGQFQLIGGSAKIQRSAVDLNNPICWQDTPDKMANTSFYQAVTVATGHVLYYKSEFKSDGYSMGDLLYSLPLAPGQKKQIVVFDSLHQLQASESQSLSQAENLAAALVDDRTITDQLGGSIGESLSGQSSATTSGISAGLGVGASFGAIGGSLGVAGGYANSNSSASQNSSRNVAQHFGERLRQAIMQNADAYRQQNASVVTTVQEGQHYSAMTEVVANHNHCHALTMMYFEVLRHFAIYQELVDVEECVFVPLLLTNFTVENIYKWRDVLARYLKPIYANTYLQPFSFVYRGRAHPLLKGFDAIDRIRTNYSNVDYPATTYDDEVIRNIKGEMTLHVSMPRPKVRYDRVKSLPVISKTVTHDEYDSATAAKSAAVAVLTGGLSLLFGGANSTKTVSEQVIAKGQIFDAFMQLDANFETVQPAKCIRVLNFRPVSLNIFGVSISVSGDDFFEDSIIDKDLWKTYAEILGYQDVFDMLEYYFKGRLIAEWDDIYYNDIIPTVFQKISDTIRIKDLNLDFTTVGRYKGSDRIVRMRMDGTCSKKRKDLALYLEVKTLMNELIKIKDYITLEVDKLSLYYSTQHYHGPIYVGSVGNDLVDSDGQGNMLPVKIYAPENEAEKRNPRDEDKHLAEKLMEHLNSNIEHYNKALWLNLDPDRRYTLLDGFNIQIFNDFGVPIGFRSLASVVKNQLMSVVGNSLVFPVAPGYKVSKNYIAEQTEEGETVNISLLDHYQPLTAPAPYRVSVPSRGVFLEAVQGACDACEPVEENSSQDWTKFTTDEPTPIGQVAPPTPTITDWKAAFKDFATPIVNIQNAPAAPAPGAGLAGLNELLGKSGVFKDITGLDGNQQNVIRTYLSNQENARAFAEMAKGMSMQDHNTSNSDKIMNTLKSAKSSGALSQDDYGKLVKSHIEQQIDGGAGARQEAQSAKPSLTDAAVQAAGQGKSVKAQKIDPEGSAESFEVEGTTTPVNVLAEAKGYIAHIKQDNTMACWAAVSTMLLSWKKQALLSIAQAMESVGVKYLQMYYENTGISAADKPAFVSALGAVAEAPAIHSVQQYIDWLNSYGPLWVTIDADSADGAFSPHAYVLIKMTGTGTPDGVGTNMVFIDPDTGNETTRTFLDFIKIFEQVVTDNKGKNLFIQIIHFPDKVQEGGVGEGGIFSKDTKVVDTDSRRIPAEISAQIEQNALRAAGTVARQVADFCKAKMSGVWAGKGGIVGMLFNGETTNILEYLDSSGVPSDFADAAAQAKPQVNAALAGLAATYRFTNDDNEYCVVQFKRESDPNLAKNYFARFAHEICHFLMQPSAPYISKDTRAYLFHPNIAETDRALGAKGRETFMEEVLGRRLNYLVHEEIDAVDNPGAVTPGTLAKACYEFATYNWGAQYAYYQPMKEFMAKFATDQERRIQLGIWLQNFWTKTTLFDNSTLDSKIKADFNLAGEFLKTVSDADFATTQSRGIQ